ncbi:MAG: AAA family ATPase, partial [Rhizobiales bacterium]|nr:AAA family ATPase [Hyphomicrobiales bacterium]
NLCEALFRLNPYDDQTEFDLNFDWPVDLWEKKSKEQQAINASFQLSEEDMESFLEAARSAAGEDGKKPNKPKFTGENNLIEVGRKYDGQFTANYFLSGSYDHKAAWKWVRENLPRFVYVDDYGAGGTQIELDQLAKKIEEKGWNSLSDEEQTIKIILDLAKINISDFLEKGQTAEGRTLRTFDKKNASAYLSRKFSDLWKQKKVDFDIEIDNTTLNILVRDEGLHMPVPLKRRSTGFRWYVAFAWRFTHATQGDFRGTVLLLEEPGIHLHPSAQADLLRLFEDLSVTNQVIYTTHLPSLVDPGFPERIRIVELENHHTRVIKGLVTRSRSPMMVVEASLGLSPEMSGLLGNRRTLIVEGQDDSTVLRKLSSLFEAEGKPHIPENVFLWPAQGAAKAPMYAGFILGHEWKGGALFDGDEEGRKAKEKVKKLYTFKEDQFFVAHLSDAFDDKDTPRTIEDIFGEDFYLEMVGEAYRLRIDKGEIANDASRTLVSRVGDELKNRGLSGLDKGRVMSSMFKKFSTWRKASDLPPQVGDNAKKLFDYLSARLAKLESKK